MPIIVEHVYYIYTVYVYSMLLLKVKILKYQIIKIKNKEVLINNVKEGHNI